MNNISKLTKSCGLAIGLTIVGYLAYHLIRWIIHKCAKTKVIDEVAHQHLPASPIRTCDDLEISPDKITMGYGEYIVFKNPQSKEKKLSQETYEKVYQVFDRYSPATIVNHASENPEMSPEEQCAKRYEWMRDKVKEIDPSLEIAFIPRTLYDLFFIQQTIHEDISLGEVGGFSHQQLKEHTEKKIHFLMDHYKSYAALDGRKQKGEEVKEIANSNYPGFTTIFGADSRRGSIFPMGIRDEKDAQIIRNAVALECSTIAQRAFLLYRGANFQKDAPFSWQVPEKPFSLSYGSSLFAGGLFAGDDAPYYYMRNGSDGYVIPIPFSRLSDSPFYIVPTNAVSQIFGNGEIFHPRTKTWKDYDDVLGGINYRLINIRPDENWKDKDKHLRSDLSREELIAQFQELKDQAIQLK